MDLHSRNISSAGTTQHYLERTYRSAVVNASKLLKVKGEDMTANQLKAWYDKSQRRAKRREVIDKEKRLIATYPITIVIG